MSAICPGPDVPGNVLESAGNLEDGSRIVLKQAPDQNKEAGRSIPLTGTDLRPSAIQKAEHVHVHTVDEKYRNRI